MRTGGTGGTGTADYLGAGAAGIPNALAPLVGKAPKLRSATLFPKHAVVSVQTAKNKAMMYTVREGVASEFAADTLTGDAAQDLDPYVFPLSELKFEGIPAMVATAQRLGLRGLTMVSCQRSGFPEKRGNVACRVHGEQSDSLDFSPAGKALGGTLGGKAVGGDGKPVDYFTSPGLVRAAILERFGDKVRLASVSLHGEYAIFSAENAARKGDVDIYDLRATGIGRPSPDRINSGPDANSKLFALDAIDWNALPALIADARTRVKLDGAVTSHVGIDKIFGNDVGIRVYLGTPHRNGSVTYDARGKFQRAH